MQRKVLIATLLFVGLLFVAVEIAIYKSGSSPPAITPPKDPLSLRNKTERDIESIYGPALSERVWFDGVSPMKKYRIADGAYIEIRYSKGLTKGTHFEIPLAWQSDDLVMTLKTCGFENLAPEITGSPNRVDWMISLPDHTSALVSLDRFERTYITCDLDFE